MNSTCTRIVARVCFLRWYFGVIRMDTLSTPRPDGLTDYQDAWWRYKRLRAVWLVICLMELGPAEIFFAGILPAVDPTTRDVVQVFVSFSILFLIDSKLRNWKCPRCARSFFTGTKPTSPLRWLFLPRRCRFCGLPKYALHSDRNESNTP
jgi:hypothetical protein